MNGMDRARAKHGRCMAVWVMLAVIAPLVGCGENWAPSIRSTVTACATAFAPAPANGALIATERTIDGYHARFELRNDTGAAATPAPTDRVAVPGLRWTLELTIPPNAAPPGKMYLEIHSWSRSPGERDGRGRVLFDPLSSPTGMSSRWQWSGPVQIAALDHGYQLDAGAYLWPQIAIASGEFSPGKLGFDLHFVGGGLRADGLNIVRTTDCYWPGPANPPEPS